MINEIKEMLERGEVVELECIDVYGFINNNKGHVREKEEILSSSLVVHSVDDGRNVVLHSSYFLRESDLEYFRIKRPAPTFDDLIDVAVQAYKDGVIKSLKLLDYGAHSLSYSVNADANGDENTIFSQHKDYSDGINFIKSLYTETFVIESEEDINKIKWVVAEAKLSNGKGIPLDILDGSLDPYYTFCLLKGATVTQKLRG